MTAKPRKQAGAAPGAGRRQGGGSPGGQARGAGRPPLLCVADAARAAEQALPPDVRDFVAGGSGAELTLAANRAALDSVFLAPRVLVDVSACDTAADLLGCRAAMPAAVAPMAFQRIVHPDGEVALARAARTAGIPYTASILSSVPLEDIAAQGGTTWFQLYWLRDRGQVREMIGRAERAGCRALVLSVDLPRMGRRLRDLRNGFVLPPGIGPANLNGAAATVRHNRAPGASGPAAHTAAAMDPSLSWRDVEWLRGQTTLPLVLKGVLDPRDAARAADLGAAGLVVSNHGGRQFDGAPPAIAALPAVRDAVDGRCEVLMDGGVRGGTDVLKALARGASGVLTGRAALWGLAAGGEDGAAEVLGLLRRELEEAMALAGCPDVAHARELRVVAQPGAGWR